MSAGQRYCLGRYTTGRKPLSCIQLVAGLSGLFVSVPSAKEDIVGKIAHVSVGATLSRAEFEDDSTHKIGGTADLNVVRTATKVVASSTADAAFKAMADDACDGVADDETIQALSDAIA